MPVVKVAITKRSMFQGQNNEYSNVYSYQVITADEPNMRSLVEYVRERERDIHSTAVEFIAGRCWELGTLSNVMVVSDTWTGLYGRAIDHAAMYKECAILVQWPLPRVVSGGRSRHRALKKWFHTNSLHGYGSSGEQARSALATTETLYIALQGLSDPNISGATICNEDGEEPTTGFKVGKYLEHRQFPTGRKEYAGIL